MPRSLSIETAAFSLWSGVRINQSILNLSFHGLSALFGSKQEEGEDAVANGDQKAEAWV